MIADRPLRIQRKRTKGWRMPPNTVYVGRPTLLGNPFHSNPDLPRSLALEAAIYRDWLLRELGTEPLMKPEHAEFWRFVHRVSSGVDLKRRAEYIKNALPLLRGKNLACFCPLDHPCHADILLELANR